REIDRRRVFPYFGTESGYLLRLLARAAHAAEPMARFSIFRHGEWLSSSPSGAGRPCGRADGQQLGGRPNRPAGAQAPERWSFFNFSRSLEGRSACSSRIENVISLPVENAFTHRATSGGRSMIRFTVNT